MKHLNIYKNENFNSKSLTSYITEYIIKKKLDTPINSEGKYHPKTKEELIKNIKECFNDDNYDLNCIDTRAITDMSNLFNINFYNHPIINNKTNNINISKWNVSNVINMKLMFNGFENFNCDLSGWDVSNVEDMNSMFSFCKNFKGNGLEKWDVSNVKDMKVMFYNCENFDCDLSNWDVSKVENMYTMFEGCSKFKGKGLDNWNISNVENMYYMLHNCKSITNKPSWYKDKE